MFVCEKLTHTVGAPLVRFKTTQCEGRQILLDRGGFVLEITDMYGHDSIFKHSVQLRTDAFSMFIFVLLSI